MSQEETPIEDGEQEDEDPGAEPFYPSQSPDKMQVLLEYLPEEDNHIAKTLLDTNDPKNVAGLKMVGKFFPHLELIDKIIREHIEEYAQAKISKDGMSRGEFERMIRASHGENIDEDGSSTSIQLLAAESED